MPREASPRPGATELIDSLEAAERLADEWDRLAVSCGAPTCAPAWQLAWWRHHGAADAALRILVLREEGRLLAVAPFFTRVGRGARRDYRLLGAELTHRVGPLAEPGREADAAAAFASALASVRPRPHLVSFEGVDANAPWPRALKESWPGRLRPWELQMITKPAPVLSLDAGSYEEWLAAKSSNFRQQMRRLARRLEEAGATVRMTAESDDVESDMGAFVALHRGRWEGRGGSSLPEGIEGMLVDAARALLPSERFRLWLIEVEGRAISAQLFLAAGPAVHYFNGGFDPDWAASRPGLRGILAAVEDAFRRGERIIDFGGGDDEYKRRFASADHPLRWTGLVPRDARYPASRARLASKQLDVLGRRLGRRLPPGARQAIKRALRR